MDKKKLQDFIQKLQEVAMELNDKEEEINNQSLQYKAAMNSSIVSPLSSESGDEAYVTVKDKSGTVIGYGDRIVLQQNDYITIEIDYLGLIAAHGYSLSNIKGCNMVFCGLTKRLHCGPSIYTLSNNQLIGEDIGVNNMYGVDLYALYNQYGTASFKLVADWDGTENIFIFSLNVGQRTIQSLEVINPPVKTCYWAHEPFDDTGMAVRAIYSNGEYENYTGYSVSPERVTRAKDYVTLFCGQIGFKVTTTQAITVEDKQHIGLTHIVYSRSRSDKDEKWPDWFPTTQGIITINNSATYQVRTVLKIDKRAIDLRPGERAGIYIVLYKKAGNGISDPLSHFRINNRRFAFNPNFQNQIFYAGDVSHGETGDFEIVLEYDDAYFEFELNSQGDSVGTIYFDRYYDSEAKREVKTIPVAAGEYKVDLFSGLHTYELPVIDADSTPLGIKLSHVFGYNEGGAGCGYYCRLNLMERLEVESVPYDEYIDTHTYTDGYGERKVFDVVFYYVSGSTRHYLTKEQQKDIVVDEMPAGITRTYNGFIVFIEYVDANNQIYIPTLSTVSNNSYYQSIANDQSNQPIYWLLSGNSIKGFNANGYLVLIVDEFDNYIGIKYNDDKIVRVENGNNNYINLNYDNGKLSYIVDSCSHRVDYVYSDEDGVQANDFGGSRISKIKFSTSESNGSAGEAYKIIEIDYQRTTINGVVGYGITSISTSDNLSTTISYESSALFNSRVTRIGNFTTSVPVSIAGEQKISEFDFDYDSSGFKTTITDIDDNEEIYTYDANCNLNKYCKIVNNKVAEYNIYDYNKYSLYDVTKSKRANLNKYTLDNFTFQGEDSEENILNYINRRSVSKTTKYSDTAKCIATTEYSYDDLHRCTIKQITREYYNLAGTTLQYKDKEVLASIYDTEKLVVTKIITHYSHFENGVEIKDKSGVTEYEYDSNGNIINEISYNGAWTSHSAGGTCTCNFSNSDKFYSQYSYDSMGRITRSETQDGLYYDSYEYYNDTMNVKKISHQGRSDIFYSFNSANDLTKVSATDGGLENCAITDYSLGEVVELNHSGNRPIEFEYDGKRRVSKIRLNGNDYLDISYEDKVQSGSYTIDKATSVNAKNETMSVESDRAGSFEKVYYNSQLILQKNYNTAGYQISSQDSLAGIAETFNRGTHGGLNSYSRTKSGENYSETYSYDCRGNVTGVTYSGAVTRMDTFTYTADHENNISKIVTGPDSDIIVTPAFDVSNRYTGATVQASTLQLTEGISYYKSGDHATNLPKVYSYTVKKSGSVKSSGQITLTYDSNENISSITEGGEEIKYTYDSLGRLIKEENEQLGKVYAYTYDNNGNILTKKIDGTTIAYAYDGDKLVSYNGQSCAYDAIGNPTTYRGKTATWVRGRKLASYNGNTFTYDAQGSRIGKNNISYVYDSNGRLLKQSNGLEFYYDVNGVIGIKYGGITYLCRKDLQGNIVALIDNNGNTVVEYKYDAWGNHKVVDANGNEITSSTHIGNLNPFRYRGYYYDVETGLYFLKSRYYDPEVGRFISLDNVFYVNNCRINGVNLYAYCINNPVMYIDTIGLFPRKIISRNPYIGIDDAGTENEHVHIKYNGKEYTWYKNSKHIKHGKNFGFDDVSRTMEKELRSKGLDEGYFQSSYVKISRYREKFKVTDILDKNEKLTVPDVPNWQEEMKTEDIPDFQEEFKNEGYIPPLEGFEVGTVILGGIVILGSLALAYFTGGQSLLGLLLL